MNRLIRAFAGAAVCVAIALVGWIATNPPAVSQDAIAAHQESDRYLAAEIARLRNEIKQLRDDEARWPREPREERVIDLPEDGGRYHLSLFLADDWESRPLRRVHDWFGSDARLAALRAQCHFHVYTPTTHPWRSGSYLANETPAVILQRRDGYVVFKVSGHNVPESASQLADLIADCRPRPRPTPPTPTPPSPHPDLPPVIPDTIPLPDAKPEPDVVPVEAGPGMLFYIVSALLGGGIGGIVNGRKDRPF